MSANRYLPAARVVAQAIPGVLAQRGLKPFISRYVLTETEQGNAWLFIVLEVSPSEHPEDYASSDVLHYLTTALHGLPVVISNSYGMRYAVLLSASMPQGHNQKYGFTHEHAEEEFNRRIEEVKQADAKV